MRFQAWGMVSAALALTGCGLFGGGGPSPDHCEIKVVKVDQWVVHDAGLDAAYQVTGVAGSPGTVWLAAETGGAQGYVSGYGLDVGPGRFDAVVDLKLTGRPRHFLAVLEVAGRRCKADAEMPGG